MFPLGTLKRTNFNTTWKLCRSQYLPPLENLSRSHHAFFNSVWVLNIMPGKVQLFPANVKWSNSDKKFLLVDEKNFSLLPNLLFQSSTFVMGWGLVCKTMYLAKPSQQPRCWHDKLFAKTHYFNQFLWQVCFGRIVVGIWYSSNNIFLYCNFAAPQSNFWSNANLIRIWYC